MIAGFLVGFSGVKFGPKILPPSYEKSDLTDKIVQLSLPAGLFVCLRPKLFEQLQCSSEFLKKSDGQGWGRHGSLSPFSNRSIHL